jgi:hypothetical protein
MVHLFPDVKFEKNNKYIYNLSPLWFISWMQSLVRS